MSFGSQATLAAQQRRLHQELQRHSETGAGRLSAQTISSSASDGIVTPDFMFCQAFNRAFVSRDTKVDALASEEKASHVTEANVDFGQLHNRLSEVYSFVAQTTQFLEILSTQVLRLRKASESPPLGGRSAHVGSWDADILNQCLEAVNHLKTRSDNLNESSLTQSATISP